MSKKAVARFALAMLLAWVVPIHATAAAMAGLCMALGHHDAPGAHAHDADSDAHPAHQDDGAQADGQHGGHCAPCAACCGAASIAGLPEIPVDAAASFAPLSEPLSHFAGRLPDRLDRPPLSL